MFDPPGNFFLHLHLNPSTANAVHMTQPEYTETQNSGVILVNMKQSVNPKEEQKEERPILLKGKGLGQPLTDKSFIASIEEHSTLQPKENSH